ncbi:hypothetical protein SLG_10190 [Sphingobium sp. SYK-6]|uniref:glycosyltransferase n=1 Tax=Sphingobium sp. (strain NBRC 103272 / SYK-6) TaxID=627192 RepID=UPI0002276EB3|nr:glycosyltransferase [Sphingobium sp. SYK-6]BAK65694.1 hypothetical protein SLG_10190 [Sphingobium sp. SYK-6]
MRICFVGHAFHKLSRSHIFFLDILKALGSVEEYYHSPDDPRDPADDIVAAIAAKRFDRYIFWQTEYIASELLCATEFGRMILIPMFDAASHYDETWWQRFQMHRFIAFSRAMHETLQCAGLDSSYFQYFPEPAAEPITFAEPEGAFFWERRPMERTNASQVRAQCRALGLTKLHVHAAPDRPHHRIAQSARLAQMKDGAVPVSVSGWFDDRAALDACASTFRFYFAPRTQEGIGATFLEAMARGQIVLAPDAPTMNEYIGHLSSGILYDPDAPLSLPILSKSDLDRISTGAFQRVRLGHERWLKDRERLNSIILDDRRRWSYSDSAASFGNLLRREAHERALRRSVD